MKDSTPKELWNLLTGKKTYLVALFMVLLGLYFLLGSPQATWDLPDGAQQAVYRRVVGWVLLSQGAAVAALRHGISTVMRSQ